MICTYTSDELDQLKSIGVDLLSEEEIDQLSEDFDVYMISNSVVGSADIPGNPCPCNTIMYDVGGTGCCSTS